MESDRGVGPVYVGGLDRSGKTTLSGYLSSHPRISIPAVGSNMWTYFYGQYGDLSREENFQRCLNALLCYKHVRFLEPDRARIEREFHAGPASYAHLFSLFLKHFAEGEGKARWGAQTGLIERYADHLFDAYDDLRIVHMLRDPRDRYLASLERWPNGKGRAGGATARWNYSTRLADRHVANHPHHYLIVRFEDLVHDTECTLREVCGFLGEDYHPAMLEMDAAPRHRGRLRETAAVGNPEELLSPDHIGRFAGKVPERELAFMELHAGRRMRAHGYEATRTRLGVAGRLRFGALDWPNQAARLVAWRAVEESQQRFPRILGRKPGARMIVDDQ